MTPDLTRAAGRRHRRRLKLGAKPICVFDGETAPEALRPADRAWLEAHHVFGFAHDPDSVLCLCLNCHAKVSAGQVDDRVPLRKQGTELERQHAMLLAWASFLRRLVEALLDWAERLQAVIAGLDADFADWRDTPWAR
jgi:hypothetical protein